MTAPAGGGQTAPELSDFVLLERLGSGASAVVHRALHTATGQVVALKVWQRPLNDTERERFARECAMHRQLTAHPAIVDFLWAAAPHGEAAWIATALCDESLADRLRRAPRLTAEEAYALADDLLSGLAEIHRRGHLHRDVKPANVLLRGGRAMLGDLGLARPVTAQTAYPSAGTGGYLAPELGRGEPADPRTDVYAAAVVLYEIFGEDIPAPLEDLLTRASSLRPGDRPADAGEFLERLRAWHAGAGTAAEAPAIASLPRSPADPPATLGTPGRSGRAAERGRRRRRFSRTAVLLVVLLVLGGTVAWTALASGRLDRSGDVSAGAGPMPSVSADAPGPRTATPTPLPTGGPSGGPVGSTSALSTAPGTGPTGSGAVGTGRPPTGTGSAPATPPNAGNVILSDDFSVRQGGWATGAGSASEKSWRSGRYDIKIIAAGYADFSAAPAPRTATAERVTATARLTGQGGWGVWCRGTSGGERYEFSVTHAGNAYIKTPSGGTSPVPVRGLDAYQDNTVIADCRDAANGVQLSLRVNGTLVTSYMDRGSPLLPPGRVGLHTFAFGDIGGDLADVGFRSFSVAAAA